MDGFLDSLQDFFENFPLSATAVGWLTLAFLLAFALAFREFWAWYTKVGSVRRELRQIQEQLTNMETLLRARVEPEVKIEENFETILHSATAEPVKSVFPLNH